MQQQPTSPGLQSHLGAPPCTNTGNNYKQHQAPQPLATQSSLAGFITHLGSQLPVCCMQGVADDLCHDSPKSSPH